MTVMSELAGLLQPDMPDFDVRRNMIHSATKAVVLQANIAPDITPVDHQAAEDLRLLYNLAVTLEHELPGTDISEFHTGFQEESALFAAAIGEIATRTRMSEAGIPPVQSTLYEQLQSLAEYEQRQAPARTRQVSRYVLGLLTLQPDGSLPEDSDVLSAEWATEVPALVEISRQLSDAEPHTIPAGRAWGYGAARSAYPMALYVLGQDMQ